LLLYTIDESDRINKAGGFVEFGRVNGMIIRQLTFIGDEYEWLLSRLSNALFHLFMNVLGNLALSRAIGDFEFKQNTGLDAKEQIVTGNFMIMHS